MGLDAVELALAWEESFGISISTAEAQTMFTTRQVAENIFAKVRSDLPEDRGSLSLRAFFRSRKAFAAEGVARPRLPSRCETRRSARDAVDAALARAGLRPLRRLPFGLPSPWAACATW